MGQNWVKCEMSVNGRWMVLTRTDLAGSLLRRISQSSFIWNSLSGRWLLLWPALCSNDRSSEAVWRGDDLSSDRHFLPLIDHRKKVPVRRAIISLPNYYRWSIISLPNDVFGLVSCSWFCLCHAFLTSLSKTIFPCSCTSRLDSVLLTRGLCTSRLLLSPTFFRCWSQCWTRVV